MKNGMKISLSLAFGVAIALAPIVLEKFQHRFGYNSTISSVGDVLWMPGQFVARLFFHEGVHTGSGSNAFIPLGLIANCIIFAGAAYLLSQLLMGARAGGSGDTSA